MAGSHRKDAFNCCAIIKYKYWLSVSGSQVVSCEKKVVVVAIMGIDDHLKRCNNLEQEWHLGLRMRLGRRWVGRRHLLVTAMGKNHKPGTGILDHVASNRRTGPRAGSSEQPRMVQPGNLIAHFHSQLGQLCSVLHWGRMPRMLRSPKMPWERADGRKGPLLTDAQPALRDPNAGALRGCENLGKLRVPRLAVVPAASAASPSSDPESFAK